MLNKTSFPAILTSDVFYKDFDGTVIVQRAGTSVFVTPLSDQVVSDCRNFEQIQLIKEGYIASIGTLSFEVKRQDFQGLN